MKSFVICTDHQELLGWSGQGERDGQVMWPSWRRTDVHIGFAIENLRKGFPWKSCEYVGCIYS
jgi:hypothetical protein